MAETNAKYRNFSEKLRDHFGKNFKLVTPGIRLADDDKGDQSRVVTPSAAVQMGADYLVIGRSITHSKDPVATLHKINDDLNNMKILT